jgi:hypothetical protein
MTRIPRRGHEEITMSLTDCILHHGEGSTALVDATAEAARNKRY